MIFGGTWQFLAVFCVSLWFFVVLGLLVVLEGSWWFLVVLG